MTREKKWFGNIWVVFFLSFLYQSSFSNDDTLQVINPDPGRFEKEIDAFIQWDKKNTYPKNAVLFVGSSSIRLWETNVYFQHFTVINRGFGGAHISDVNHFFQTTVSKYKPKLIVFYAGDNDIAYNKSVQQVIDDFKYFVHLVKKDLPESKIIFLPIKPSIARWQFWEKMRLVNSEIQEFCSNEEILHYVDTATPMLDETAVPDSSLFIGDGLHLNTKGYQLWNTVLAPILYTLYH